MWRFFAVAAGPGSLSTIYPSLKTSWTKKITLVYLFHEFFKSPTGSTAKYTLEKRSDIRISCVCYCKCVKILYEDQPSYLVLNQWKMLMLSMWRLFAVAAGPGSLSAIYPSLKTSWTKKIPLVYLFYEFFKDVYIAVTLPSPTSPTSPRWLHPREKEVIEEYHVSATVKNLVMDISQKGCQAQLLLQKILTSIALTFIKWLLMNSLI